MTTDNVLLLENYIDDNDIEKEIIKLENKEMIDKLISSLKDPYSKILYYYYIDELSLDTIAKNMNVSKGTLKMQIYRGKNILREKLERFKGGQLL